jgi:hypothetical protein
MLVSHHFQLQQRKKTETNNNPSIFPKIQPERLIQTPLFLQYLGAFLSVRQSAKEGP